MIDIENHYKRLDLAYVGLGIGYVAVILLIAFVMAFGR